MQTTYVTASELAEYIYCQCCWADTQEGLRETTAAMEQGSLEHSQIQQRLQLFDLLKRVAIVLIVLSVVLTIALVVLSSQFNLPL
jgi:hypothetical protein